MKHSGAGLMIAKIRKARGMTQRELADKCMVDVRTIQRIETGEATPRMYTLKLIASALQIPMEDLAASAQTTGHQKRPARFWHYLLGWIGGVSLSSMSTVYIFLPQSFRESGTVISQWIYSIIIVLHFAAAFFFYRGYFHLAKNLQRPVTAAGAVVLMMVISFVEVIHINQLFDVIPGVRDIAWYVGVMALLYIIWGGLIAVMPVQQKALRMVAGGIQTLSGLLLLLLPDNLLVAGHLSVLPSILLQGLILLLEAKKLEPVEAQGRLMVA